MKHIYFLAITLTVLFISCKKSGTDTTPAAEKFMTYSAGSTWNYQQVNNIPPVTTTTFSRVSTNRDSSIGSRSYHVFINSSTSASEYYGNSGNDYYTYQKLADALGGTKVENLYLKDNADVNVTWSQPYNISFSGVPLVVTVTNKIKEKGISKTVNGISYTNVIHVETTLAVAGIPSSALVTDIQFYYAPKTGLIESTNKVTLNYMGINNQTDITTRLLSATIL